MVDPGVRERRLVGKYAWTVARKVQCISLGCPYCKPTQVVRKRILRPTGEGLLRNSANWPRNFGIRGAHESEPQRIGPGNCLSKTQLSAKS